MGTAKKFGGILPAWFRDRSSPEDFFVASVPLAQLAEDPRVHCSGVSHRESPVRDARSLEVYVDSADLHQLVRDHAMLPQVDANVLFCIVTDRVGRGLLHSDSFPKACIAVDLAEHVDQRSIEAASEILRKWVAL